MEALQPCTMYDIFCRSFPSQVSASVTHLKGTSTSTGVPRLTIPASSGYRINHCTSTVNNNNVMESLTNQDQMIIDPSLDLEPQTRNRCNTWPLRPIVDPPSIHDTDSNHAEGTIKEEEPDDFPHAEHEGGSPQAHNIINSCAQDPLNVSNQLGANNIAELGSQGDLSNAKKQSARKNAWGNLSYADLITQAIQSSPEKRLTLAQIYDWMVQNVGYFRDKGDSNSSAGWKNSIRHNLSLHNRFMRIQNEGAGKSSWWVINPDAKPGKAPRRPRGNSMDSSKSMSMKATRDRAMKRVREKKAMLCKDGTISPVSPANEFTLSPGDGGYRDRASSFASNASGRRSPVHDFDQDVKLSQWDSDNRLDYEYPMDTSGKLADELDLLGLKFPEMSGGSLLNELEEINEPYNEPGSSNMPPHSMFAGKPYSTYLQSNDTGSNYNSQPPPPYPDQQQQYNNQTNSQNARFKDPMMTSYSNISNGNNNTLSPSLVPRVPQYATGYSNGIIATQSASTAAQRLTQAQNSQAQQPKVLPSSIRAALGNNVPMSRSNQISPSLKKSAPILTSQLLDYSPAPQQQQPNPFSPNQPQVINQSHQQQLTYSQYTGGQRQDQDVPNYMYNSNAQMSTPLNYLPNDLDLEMPELLSCDVDEIIQQELQMDGGQLDFSGFDGYSQQQQQQQQQQQSGSRS